MESQPQNPEFRVHPTNFHPCIHLLTLIDYITNNMDPDQTAPLGVD